MCSVNLKFVFCYFSICLNQKKTALHNDLTGNLLDFNSNVAIHLCIDLILLLAQEKNVFIWFKINWKECKNWIALGLFE
jgi:hypothetical protein